MFNEETEKDTTEKDTLDLSWDALIDEDFLVPCEIEWNDESENNE